MKIGKMLRAVICLVLMLPLIFTGCKVSSSPNYKRTGAVYSMESVADAERYGEIKENPLTKVSVKAVSTFSVDVDTASYSNIRRIITSGTIPPENAVRTEEMINYFSYNYPEPTGEDPFSVTTETGRCPWDDTKYIAKIGLKGRIIPAEKKSLSNLVFLIDVSGSMADENKLPLLKSAFKLLIDQLTENDRVSIVVYAGSSGVKLDGAHGNEKDKIISALEGLGAMGSTAGSEGINKAYELAQRYFINGGNNRIILATDGDFNVGISNPDELKSLIKEKSQSGIYLTVLGFGTGNIKDDTMETLADNGNGNYAYIDTINEAKKVLVEQMNGTLLTIAKDVKIQVTFNPDIVSQYRLIGYENRLLNNDDFNDDKKDAGEIGSGHTVTALYEIIPVTALKKDEKLFNISLKYKKPQEDTSRQIDSEARYDPDMKNITDFNFATAVAEFGLLLRNSQFKGSSSVSSIIELASANKGEDKGGYRKEFVELVKKYGELRK